MLRAARTRQVCVCVYASVRACVWESPARTCAGNAAQSLSCASLVHAEAEPSEYGWYQHVQKSEAAHQLAQIHLDADAQQLIVEQSLKSLHCSVLISSFTSE